MDATKQTMYKWKVSDGVSVLQAIVTSQQMLQHTKIYAQEVKQWCIVEVKSYQRKTLTLKNGDATQHILMIKDFRVLYSSLKGPIGDPVNYSDREKQGHFDVEELTRKFEHMDLTIPFKLPPVQPMDIDEEALVDEPKLNQRDKRLLEVDNPEEDMPNPFASGFEKPP